MNSRIVVVGSSNTDMIVKTPVIPRPGETVLGGEFLMAPGGKGANQAVAAARAGGKVTFIACVGNDMFGEEAVRGLIRDGIDVEYVFRDKQTPSGVAMIFVDEAGENSIAVASGANAKLTPQHIEIAGPAIADADILVMQLETPIETVYAAASRAAAGGATVILNPAPACPLDDELLRHISILTPNETEAELLTGMEVRDEEGARRAATALLAAGLQAVLVTLGERGAYVATDTVRTMVPGFRVTPVDSTAAGDVFNGALAVALLERTPIIEATRFANAAAALAVTKMGAQPSAPQRGEIEALVEAQP